jgi:hypothetical protein
MEWRQHRFCGACYLARGSSASRASTKNSERLFSNYGIRYNLSKHEGLAKLAGNLRDAATSEAIDIAGHNVIHEGTCRFACRLGMSGTLICEQNALGLLATYESYAHSQASAYCSLQD